MAHTQEVVTRPLDWAALVRKQWGSEYNEPEVVYEFSGGRDFESTDRSNSGIYE